ncbi:MAG: hypothetical protein ABIU87_04045 [Ornithinibacter sp.]
MRGWRYALVAVGVLVLLYGGARLVAEVPEDLPGLGLWMVGVVVIHDGLLSPLVVGVGWLLARKAPAGGRRYVQSGLVAGALVTVIAIPLIARQGTKPPAKALLLQNYSVSLAILLGLIAALNLAAYLANRTRDRHVEPAPETDQVR